jgi:hypothetical protein
MSTPAVVIVCFVATALTLGWVYFHHVRMDRPPIGVFSLWDVVGLLIGVTVMPYVYLVLPSMAAGGLLGLGMLSILACTSEPVIRPRMLRWLLLVGLMGADVLAANLLPSDSSARYLANNVVLVLVAVGASNVWAQNGLRALDSVILGLGLAVYDLLATSVFGQTDDVLQRLAGLPFAPMVAWPTSTVGHWLSIGLGDVLLASLFPLVLCRAFGRAAGLMAFCVALSVPAILLALPAGATFPLMVVLGPAMGLQYVCWRWWNGAERTTHQYLHPTEWAGAAAGQSVVGDP